MGQLVLSGSLDAGPPSVTTEAFPGASVSIPLRLRENSKTFSPATGVLRRSVNSPLAFVALTGIGTADAVTQGSFLYLKTDQTVTLRTTTDDGSGGSVVSTLPPVNGFCILEFDSALFLKLLEIKGVATVEYFVCGPQ